MSTHYTMYIGNDNAGADTNLAALNFYNGKNYSSGTFLADDAADLLAFAQYLLPAADTYVKVIEAGEGTGGGQFPVAFPTAEYAALKATDINLTTMTAYGVRYGFNDLTALGIGCVLSRRTAVPGRSGRGRLTTPWLPVSWVNANGALDSGGPAIVEGGWNTYMGNVLHFNEMLKSATGFISIDAVTASSRLGHVRSRTQ